MLDPSYSYVSIAAPFSYTGFSSLTDWLDGLAARQLNATTTFGIVYDAISDKVQTISILVAFLALGVWHPLYVFLVLAVVAREFLVTGLRVVAAVHNVVLAAEKAGKIKTAAMMVATSAILLRLAMDEYKGDKEWIPQWSSAISLIGEVLFIISVILTITSGMTYMRKYWGLLLLENPARLVKKVTTKAVRGENRTRRSENRRRRRGRKDV